jgi:hypothetical protein
MRASTRSARISLRAEPVEGCTGHRYQSRTVPDVLLLPTPTQTLHSCAFPELRGTVAL